MLFVLSIPLNENDDVICCNGKNWLKRSRELDAHFTFIAFNKDEPSEISEYEVLKILFRKFSRKIPEKFGGKLFYQRYQQPEGGHQDRKSVV